MKQTHRKRIAIVLATLILLTSAPFAGFEGIELPEVTFARAAEVIDSGTFGENLTWTLDSEGTLIISGTGDMENYTSSDAIPWRSYSAFIKNVVIEEGVTSICNWAFCNDVELTKIEIPNSVSKIYDGAFMNCSSLQSIVLPEGLIIIGGTAFKDCTSLSEIMIPDSVTEIRYSAFFNCTSLKIVNISDNVLFIGNGAFAQCTSLTAINVDANNANYCSEDGVLYDSSKTLLMCYPAGKTDEFFAVPPDCGIDAWAFSGCVYLKEVFMPEGVGFGYASFAYCTALTIINIPDSEYHIESNTFIGCTALTTVNFGKNSQLREISYGAFSGCISLNNISLPDSVTTIGIEAFAGCTSLREIVILDGVTEIGPYAFDACTSLTSIDVEINNEFYSSLNGVLYNKEKTTLIHYPAGKIDPSFVIPNSVTSIVPYAFSGCISLQSVTFEENSKLTSIDTAAFMQCFSLLFITVPDKVESIGQMAFAGCTSLETVFFDENSQLTNIGDSAFVYCSSLTEISIPVNVTNIGTAAFGECTALTEINIPDNVKNIEQVAFYGCTSLTAINIPSSVESIGYGAFEGCTSLSAVYIKNIDAWCNIVFDDIASSPLVIAVVNGSHCPLYLNNEPVTEITFSASRGTEIKDFSLCYCLSLTKAEIQPGISTIGKYAFAACSAMSSILLSSDVKVIEDDAFNYCLSLKNVYYSGTEEEWNAISIGINNDYLLNANIHFNSTGVCDHVESTVTQPENCTVNGYILTVCDLCGELLSFETIPAAHVWGEWVEKKTATCVQNGEETRTCGRCGETESRETDLDEHTFGEWCVVTEPTLDADGKQERKCSACPLTEEDPIPALLYKEYVNEESGIGVGVTKEAYGGKDITVEIEEVFDGSQFVTNIYGKSRTWNIKTHLNGEQVQPLVPVFIRIPIPADYNASKIFVYHINSQTGVSEKLASEVIDGYICFYTNSFSLFIVVDESSIITPAPGETDEPDTPANDCDHLCHKSGIIGFFWKIIRVFQKLFGLNPVCECGVAHY